MPARDDRTDRTGDAAPRHGRHAAQPQRGQQASSSWRRPQAPRQQDGKAASPDASRIPLVEPDADSFEQAAPRPVLDPAATGSFQRIDASQGAVVTNRHNAEETSGMSREALRQAQKTRLTSAERPQVRSHEAKTRMSRPVLIVIVAVAALVVIGAFFFVHKALTAQDGTGQDQVVEQTQTDTGGTIEYRGTTFSLEQQDDGKYALMGKTEGQDQADAYFEIEGDPVQLVLYNGAIIIPENLPDGTWDVYAYTIGDGSVPTQVMDSDGNPVTGQGQIASVSLQDPNLVVTDSAGATTQVALA